MQPLRLRAHFPPGEDPAVCRSMPGAPPRKRVRFILFTLLSFSLFVSFFLQSFFGNAPHRIVRGPKTAFTPCFYEDHFCDSVPNHDAVV
jgi:hypothetical protein